MFVWTHFDNCGQGAICGNPCNNTQNVLVQKETQVRCHLCIARIKSHLTGPECEAIFGPMDRFERKAREITTLYWITTGGLDEYLEDNCGKQYFDDPSEPVAVKLLETHPAESSFGASSAVWDFQR